MRQIYFTGVQALRFVALIAVMAGVAIVVQAQLWFARVGQIEMLGPMLVMVLFRELGPVIVNFVVIGRSGTAIAAEVASMRVERDLLVLESQGIDLMRYLVVPRVLGMSLSVLCLTVFFIVVAFASGYVCGVFFGVGPADPSVFVASLARSIGRRDIVSLLAKTLLPGAFTAAIACSEGLRIRGAVTEIPQATTRAVVGATVGLALVSGLVSLLTYM